MKRRIIFFLLAFLGCFCFAQEQPVVILSQEEVQKIMSELQNMKLSVQVLKEAHSSSQKELTNLLSECSTLEMQLNEAAIALGESEIQLIELQEIKSQLETQFTLLKKEYAALNQSYSTLKKKNKILGWVGGVLVTGLGVSVLVLALQ